MHVLQSLLSFGRMLEFVFYLLDIFNCHTYFHHFLSLCFIMRKLFRSIKSINLAVPNWLLNPSIELLNFNVY